MQTTAISVLKKTAAASTLALALCGGATAQQQDPAAALQVHVARVNLADLEEAFWMCEYVAATHGAGAEQIVTCSAVYDALKERKFAGDFDGLLAWWRQNKPAQLARLAALDRQR